MARDATPKEMEMTAEVRTNPPELPSAVRPGTRVSVPRIGTPSPKPRMPSVESPRAMLAAVSLPVVEKTIPLPRRTLANFASDSAADRKLNRETHERQMAEWRQNRPVKKQVRKNVSAWLASLPSSTCQ